MNQAIINVYFRAVLRGTRTISAVPDTVRAAVTEKAEEAHAKSEISSEQYDLFGGSEK